MQIQILINANVHKGIVDSEVTVEAENPVGGKNWVQSQDTQFLTLILVLQFYGGFFLSAVLLTPSHIQVSYPF